MKQSKFSESQIVAILKEGDAGVPVAELLLRHGVSSATYYKWKSKYAGQQIGEVIETLALSDVANG